MKARNPRCTNARLQRARPELASHHTSLRGSGGGIRQCQEKGRDEVGQSKSRHYWAGGLS